MSPELDMDAFTEAMISPMHRTASCVCGTTTVSVNGEPEIYGLCHCSDCKRRTGSAFGIAAYFPRKDVTHLKGETLVYALHHSTLDHDQERHFCKVCGTTLFWYISTLPELIVIAAGCFPEGSLGEPTLSVTHAKKVPWLELPPRWQTQD